MQMHQNRCTFAHSKGVQQLMLQANTDIPQQPDAHALQLVPAGRQTVDQSSQISGIAELALSPTSMQRAFQVCLITLQTYNSQTRSVKSHLSVVAGSVVMPHRFLLHMRDPEI